MKDLHSLIPIKFPASFTMIDGHCTQHGARQTLVRAGQQWFCPICYEKTVEAQTEARWFAERKADLLRNAHIPKKYRGEKFIARTAAQHRARFIVTSFLELVASGGQWAALALCGTVGTGKTRLACELAEYCASVLLRTVRYVTANEMISEIQASYSAEGKSEASEMARLINYDLLIIDEIDTKAGTENAQRLLNDIINRRYNDNKPVIVVSNQLFDALGQFVGERVHDRLHENSFVCTFHWPGYRRQVQQLVRGAERTTHTKRTNEIMPFQDRQIDDSSSC